MSALPDPTSDFGRRVLARLRTETVIWLVTVSPSGVPQPNPVWFLFEPESESLLIYNDNQARRLAGIDAHPQATAHFDADAGGGNVVVLAGELTRDPDAVAANANPPYLDKYAGGLAELGMDADEFTAKYSVALRLRISRTRGF